MMSELEKKASQDEEISQSRREQMHRNRIVTLKRGEDTHPEPGALTLQEIKMILSGVPGTHP